MEAKWGPQRFYVDVILFAAFFTLYVHTATSYFTYDAVSYALSIRYVETTRLARPLFHPHHLLFNAVGSLIVRALRAVNLPVEPLAALQLLNAFAGAVGVVTIYRFILKAALDTAAIPDVRGARWVAVSTAAACGVSFGYWIAATDGRSNMPGVAAALVAVSIAYALSLHPSAARSAMLGLAIAVAALLHQSHCLLVPVGLVAIGFSQARRRRKLRYTVWFLGTFLVVFILPYVMAASIRGIAGTKGIVLWATTYAHSGSWWSFDLPRNLWADVSALVHAYVADPQAISGLPLYRVFKWGFVLAPVVLGLAYVARLIARLMDSYAPTPLEGAKGGGLPDYRISCDSGSALLAINAICLSLAAVYALFFTFWCPGYFVFWIPVAVAGVILVAVNGVVFIRPLPAVALFFAVWSTALFVVNLVGYVVPRAEPENNPYLMLARTVERHTRAGDLVIVAGAGYLAEAELYIPYFAKRNVVSIQQLMREHRGFKAGAMDWLSKTVERKRRTGKTVYVLGELLDSDQAWKQLQERCGLKREDVLRALWKYVPVPRFAWKDQTVYSLETQRSVAGGQ